MLVTVFCAPRDRPETTFALDVSPELELRDFVALCELESGIPAGEIQILYIEQPLKDPTRALGTYGLKDGDVVVLRQAEPSRRPPPAQPTFPGLPRIDFSSIAVPGTSFSSSQRPATRPQQQPSNPQQQQQQQQQRSPPPPAPPTLRGSSSSPQGLDDPALLQQMLLANPHELSLLKERNPPLAEALLSGDLERFTKVLSEQQQDRARREQERIRLLTADPFDLDAQAKIEEDIRQHNVEENMTIAMEEAPESFGQVVMLYINCKVNEHPVKAFVDSGAQMTIMSQACAERCNIMRLVDRRWAGIAKGVGTQKIIGRVHLAQVQIEGDFLPCSFSILEDQPMDMLLGLDMLKRHQCSIDLKKSSLLIGTTGTETRFLPEAELPECARLAYGPEGREDVRPEEMADRELAEALQRSVQESDTADGQTTSPDSPPFPTPTPLRQAAASSSSPSSSSSSLSHPRSLTLDRSKSAPASMQQALTPRPNHSPSGFQEVHGPSSPSQETAPTTPQAPLPPPTKPPLDPLPPPTNPTLDPLPTPTDPTPDPPPAASAADLWSTCTPSAPAGPEGWVTAATQTAPGSEWAADATPAQPMEEGGGDPAEPCPSSPEQREAEGGGDRPGSPRGEDPGSRPAETTESPDRPRGSAAPAEREHPEGERERGAAVHDSSIPSLAAALRELHQLLVSSSHARPGDRSASRSPPHPSRLDADGLDDNLPAADQGDMTPESPPPPHPPPPPPPSSTAITAGAELSNAKANHAAESARASPECLAPGSSGREESAGREAAAEVKGLGRPRGSDGPWDGAVGGYQGLEDTRKEGGGVPGSERSSPPQGDPESREPPEGQQERGVADGRAFGADPPDDALGPRPEPGQLSPEEHHGVSATSNPQVPPAASPAPLFSAPQPPAERFPYEHLQRIQAAGFSAREAADALEQAQGSVELALLALLARNITVPT